MKKWLIILCAALLVVLIAGQAVVTYRFTRQPPRIEVYGFWEGGVLSDSDKAAFVARFPGSVIESHPESLYIAVQPNGSPFYAKEIAEAVEELRIPYNSVLEVGVYDYTHAHTLTWQFPRITAFGGAVLLCVLVARFILTGGGRWLSRIREECRYVTPGVYFCENAITLLTVLIGYAVLIFAGIFGLVMASFPLYITPRFLPPRYFFDWGFYWNMLKTGIHIASGSAFSRSYVWTLLIGAASTGMNLILMTILCRQGCRFIQTRGTHHGDR